MIEIPIAIAIALGTLLTGFFVGVSGKDTERHQTDKYIACVKEAQAVRECAGLEK